MCRIQRVLVEKDKPYYGNLSTSVVVGHMVECEESSTILQQVFYVNLTKSVGFGMVYNYSL